MITTLEQRAQARQLWFDLRDALQDECKRFNTHPAITERVPVPTLCFEPVSDTEVRLHLHSQQGDFCLSVVVDPDLFYILYRAHAEPYTCMALIDVDEQGAFLTTRDHQPDLLEDAANAMVNTLIVGYL
jgi:hypothetical protein